MINVDQKALTFSCTSPILLPRSQGDRALQHRGGVMSSSGGGGKSLGHARLNKEIVGRQPLPWTPIETMVQQVKTWPNINRDQVEMAYRRAKDQGILDAYQAAVAANPTLALVVTPNGADIASTCQYAIDRMKDVLGRAFTQWPRAYSTPLTADRIVQIARSPLFVAGRVKIEVVDLGAYAHHSSGFLPIEIQSDHPDHLAGVQVLFAASQHPEWVRRMDGIEHPFALAPALLVNADRNRPWQGTPRIWKNGKFIDLDVTHIRADCLLSSAPCLRDLSC